VNQLVFLDEFAATTTMQRTHGRAPRGQRVVCKVPHGHYKSLSTIAAMAVGGMVAAASFDGATDTELFTTFVRESLVPVLQAGQVVIMDNLRSHHAAEVQRLIASAGCQVLYLPPYSPDFNPIELAISKIKTLLRKEARRTVEGVLEAIELALKNISAADALHYMQYRGYTLQ